MEQQEAFHILKTLKIAPVLTCAESAIASHVMLGSDLNVPYKRIASAS